MELTTKQEKQLGQTQWFHATLLRHLESLKKGIDVKFNLGSELDFGPGFYITPDFEQARKFINKQVEVLNRSTSNNSIFDSEEEVGIIVEFRISNFIEIFKNPDYHCHYFAKHKKSESEMAVVSLENNIKLYSSELFQALLKASNYKLDKRIAQTVAEGYARNLDYSDPELMHVGVTSVANNLLTKIKQEYFNV